MPAFLTQRRILLTGSTGFIGSHLLKRLVRDGNEVHVSIRKSSSTSRIDGVLKDCTSHFIDLTDSNAVRSLVRDIKPEMIFHLAAYGVDYKQQDVFEAINVNITSSINLFNSLIENGGVRFIHTGTSMEYGSKDTPTSEIDFPDPKSTYGITKYASVKLLSLMADQANVDLITLRPFSTFGELEGKHKLIPYVISTLRQGLTLKLTEGAQIRDFLYIDDLIDAYIKAAITPIENRSEIINIGSGRGISLKEIVLIIARVLDSDLDLINFGPIPYRPNEIMYLVADNRKAKALLNWEPNISVESGIRTMISTFD